MRRALDRVDVVQPALLAVMVSLAELWRSVGVVPGRGDRPFAGRDRGGVCGRGVVAGGRRDGGGAAEPVVGCAVGRARAAMVLAGVWGRARRRRLVAPVTAIGSVSPRSMACRRWWFPVRADAVVGVDAAACEAVRSCRRSPIECRLCVAFGAGGRDPRAPCSRRWPVSSRGRLRSRVSSPR